MSNEILIPTGQLPAHLQGYQSETSSDIITSTLVLPRISLRGKQFRFRKDDSERALPLGAPLRVVILGATPKKGCSKIYYDDPYSEGSDDAPACSSANGVTPDSWVMTPVSPSCATCPMNAWGSAHDSSGQPTKGKACADSKQLLVVPPDQPDGEMWLLRVPPASLKLLSNYGYKLQQHKIPIEGVVTEITFVDAEYPRVDFNYFGFTDERFGRKFIDRVQSEEFKEVVAKLSNVVPIDAQQVSQTAAPAPAQKAQPTQDTIEEIPWGESTTSPQTQTTTTQQVGASQQSQANTAASQQQQPAAQTPSGAGIQAPDGSYYVSPAGETFDASKHATKSGCVAGAIKQDGSFKVRKGAGSKEPAQQPAPAATQTSQSLFDSQPATTADTQEEDNAELQSILDQWGT